MADGAQHDQVFVRVQIALRLGSLQDLQDKIMDRLLISQKTRMVLKNMSRHFPDKPELLRIETRPLDIGDIDCLKLIDGR